MCPDCNKFPRDSKERLCVMGDTGELGHTPPDVSRYTIFVKLWKDPDPYLVLMDPDPGGPKTYRWSSGYGLFFLDMDSDPVMKF